MKWFREKKVRLSLQVAFTMIWKRRKKKKRKKYEGEKRTVLGEAMLADVLLQVNDFSPF